VSDESNPNRTRPVSRRRLLKGVAAIMTSESPSLGAAAAASGGPSRVRPKDLGWPSEESWARLSRSVGGRLIKVQSPLHRCRDTPIPACAQIFGDLKNPYYLGDEVGLTQTLGWIDAWTSSPSAYAVVAETTDDVAATVNFARENNLRVVVKGGGHSYQGTSNSADSLLIWTRRMNAITLHDAFVGARCAGVQEPQQAVTVGAGAIWGQVYHAVTTKAGRYVQGGGCLTVGVAGLIQSGGFGSFSKAYGMAASSLLEAEVVTADGEVRIANSCVHPDLFWALKGGGGGSFGVVTRLTLATHPLPEFFGAVFMTIRATSEAAFRQLIEKVLAFYREALLTPNWGEQIGFRPAHTLSIAMVFAGLDQQHATDIWRPFFDWVASSPLNFRVVAEPRILAAPARRFWDPAFLEQIPGLVLSDPRPGAPSGNVFWASNQAEAGQMLHGYESVWLSASLLDESRRGTLVEALLAASRHWSVTLHVNKGLAGAPHPVVAAASDTAISPAVLDAFALAISAAGGPPAYPGIRGYEPDLAAARRSAVAVGAAMSELRKIVPSIGSYVAESNFFERRWHEAFWGANYAKLLTVKNKYDRDGLFFVHHGVGSERWSPDGFRRLVGR
jgi:FAD/FMN-containing dehydrogenase